MHVHTCAKLKKVTSVGCYAAEFNPAVSGDHTVEFGPAWRGGLDRILGWGGGGNTRALATNLNILANSNFMFESD